MEHDAVTGRVMVKRRDLFAELSLGCFGGEMVEGVLDAGTGALFFLGLGVEQTVGRIADEDCVEGGLCSSGDEIAHVAGDLFADDG